MQNKKELIDQVRAILDRIENDTEQEDDRIQFAQNFNAFELPSIVEAIVDYLQPSLNTYAAALYWYMFRNSVLATGQQYTRVSTRGLQEGVVMSKRGQSTGLTYGTVQSSLSELEEKGAIIKAGETNREGTLYKVNLPEEIGLCQEALKRKSAAYVQAIDEKRELDYYNVADNRRKVFERDDYRCHYCAKQLTRFTATLDHIQPVSEGGDNSFDNLTTACLHCNSRRGSRPVSDMLIEHDR